MAPPATSTGTDGHGSLAGTSSANHDSDIPNRSGSTGVAANNEDEEADHSMTILAAHVELSQKPRMSWYICSHFTHILYRV